MIKVFMLIVGILFALQSAPASAADDGSFLQQLGGVVSKDDGGILTVSFKEGTKVTLSGSCMSTTDINGRVFISDTTSSYLAVSIPGQAVVTYNSPVDLADLDQQAH